MTKHTDKDKKKEKKICKSFEQSLRFLTFKHSAAARTVVIEQKSSPFARPLTSDQVTH